MMDFYEVLSPAVGQLCGAGAGAGTFLLQMLVTVTEWSLGVITTSCVRVVPFTIHWTLATHQIVTSGLYPANRLC